MALYLISRASTAIVSTADLKAHLRVEHTAEDTLIAAYGAAAVAHLEGADGWLGRALAEQTWELKLDDFCGGEIRLPLPPLVSVESVKYYDASDVLQTLSTAAYQVIGVNGNQPGKVALNYGYSWPTVRIKREAVVVRFKVGYLDPAINALPTPISQALKLLVGHWYVQREPVLVGSIAEELPLTVKALLAPYQVEYFG